MTTAITVPQDLWDDDSQGALSIWYYQSGDRVEAGTVIAEVMNEKVSSEITAPVSGVLEIVVPADQPVDKGEAIGRISPA